MSENTEQRSSGFLPLDISLLVTMVQNNLQLISIADNKASFLLGTNFLMLIALVNYTATHTFHALLFVPVFLLGAIITSSILVLSPVYVKSSDSDISNKLFFGWVAKQEYTKYKGTYFNILKDEKEVYNLLLTDYYQTCHILSKKFLFLKLSYRLSFSFVLLFIFIFLYLASR
ncbi:Pycsar system effector family protein [Legionella waltersii]|uniref:Pycsar effector protein domain-containing protein n=1 Tax=Legionella waltersii TaxID=66969 RepID=A0A0W1AMV3_9GAMM|nr:Pycsar system effector family protein [Legionella waltersii]KTD82520.1 hypothetical protein Lwal_0637 [Legionella waltersii]SNV03021.1 Uncharacterised protein [Legionella waltersii]